MSVTIRTNFKKTDDNNNINGNDVAGNVATINLNGNASSAVSVRGRFNQPSSTVKPSTAGRPPPRQMAARNTPAKTPSRFAGMKPDEGTKPSFGGSAADRMAQFREAAEKEKAQADRKKQAEEKKKIEASKPKVVEPPKKEEPKAEEKEEEEEEENTTKKSQAPCKKKRTKQKAQRTMSISNIVMDWVQEMTKDYEGVEIKNFSTSWSNGLAFCALIHKFNPDAFDFKELTAENRRHNFDLAFNTGQKCRKIPLLLDTNDLLRMKKPEPRSVQTYVQWIWSVYGPESGYGPSQEEIKNATIA